MHEFLFDAAENAANLVNSVKKKSHVAYSRKYSVFKHKIDLS